MRAARRLSFVPAISDNKKRLDLGNEPKVLPIGLILRFAPRLACPTKLEERFMSCFRLRFATKRSISQILVAALAVLAAPVWAEEGSEVSKPVATDNSCGCSGAYSDCCCDSNACCCMPDDCCCSTWFARIDALILTRDNASINQPVVLTDDTDEVVLTTRDLNFGWDAGPRAFIGNYYRGSGGWELGYFGINGRTATASAEDPNNLDIPPPLSAVANDFDNANAMTLSWNWRINNAEFNLFNDSEPFQFLAGFRYFNLDEQFNIRAEDADGDVSDYHLSTSNTLFGAQIGARAYREWYRLGLGATGKAGIFGNDAIERQIVRDNNNVTVLRDARGRVTTTSFVGDIDLFLTYRISDIWRLRGGYYLLWVSDVALAPDQLDFSFNTASGTQVRDSGSVFFHGATAGIEATW